MRLLGHVIASLTHRCWLAALFGAALVAIDFWNAALAADQIVYKHNGTTTHLAGKVVVVAQDGGLLLLAPDGKLWNITPDQLVERRQDDQPFAPFSNDELRSKVLAELPAGFDTHSTAHYLIFYNTSRGYAQWCGALFERLYTAFTNFWTRRGFKLHEPEMPLVVVVYADRDVYASHSADELGNNAARIVGFYSLQTNRVKMYDLTGADAMRQSGDRRGDSAQITRLLSRPEAAAMVATVIHEATHQIAFNCGLQQRFADIPLWVSEGLAMYFETPDLNFGKGWRTIGEVNRPRIERFQEYLHRRPPDSLATLLADDKRFRDPQQALDAYAEAWALNYFLLRQHAKEYQAYLERLAEKGPLVWDKPEERIAEFKATFGSNLAALDAEFVRYMVRIR